MSSLIVIPSRFGSTRLQGKPLHLVSNRPLLERVVDIARRASTLVQASYIVATDHHEIEAFCRSIHAPVVMTDPGIKTGSDRVFAAASMQGTPPDFVVNLQGDAPFTEAKHVAALILEGQKESADVVTTVVRLSWEELDKLRKRKSCTPFSGTTCIVGKDNRALWFSKQIIPAIREEKDLRALESTSPVFRHIGLYGYRYSALKKFTELPVGHYEDLEGLEQLRFIENGMTVGALPVAAPHISMSGIDSPEDVLLAEQLIRDRGDPFGGL